MARGSVVASVESLPDRFKGDPEDRFDARIRLRIGSLVRDVVITPRACEVAAPAGAPDAEISTSPATWLAMEDGRLSGVEAFAAGRLTLRGSIQTALRFEPLFERESNGALVYEVERVDVGREAFSMVTAGDPGAPPLVLLHGLGATKASLLPVVPQLARHFRVFAPDLPGFGESTKPRGRYDAPWFADRVFELMDELGLDSALVAGNSMGGRIAQEMAMLDPSRVDAIACLCPATAFAKRPGLWLARLLRPELGFFVGFVPRQRVTATLRDLFARSSRVDPSWYEAAADDFLRTWKSPRARMSFFAAARNIYLDEPYGERGFFTRLERLDVPAFYVYGRHDPLITPTYGRKIRKLVPAATVEVWDDCGHVPQIEHPDRTAQRLVEHFSRALAGSELAEARRASG